MDDNCVFRPYLSAAAFYLVFSLCAVFGLVESQAI